MRAIGSKCSICCCVRLARKFGSRHYCRCTPITSAAGRRSPTTASSVRRHRHASAFLATRSRRSRSAIASGSPCGRAARDRRAVHRRLPRAARRWDRRLRCCLPVTINSRCVALVAAHCGDDRARARTMSTSCRRSSTRAAAPSPACSPRAQKAAGPATITKRVETEGYEIEVSIADVGAKRTQLDKFRKSQMWPEARRGHSRADPRRHGARRSRRGRAARAAARARPHRGASSSAAPTARSRRWRSAQTIDASEPRILDALEAAVRPAGPLARMRRAAREAGRAGRGHGAADRSAAQPRRARRTSASTTTSSRDRVVRAHPRDRSGARRRVAASSRSSTPRASSGSR